jgi:hypothetical protein
MPCIKAGYFELPVNSVVSILNQLSLLSPSNDMALKFGPLYMHTEKEYIIQSCNSFVGHSVITVTVYNAPVKLGSRMPISYSILEICQ